MKTHEFLLYICIKIETSKFLISLQHNDGGQNIHTEESIHIYLVKIN